LNRATKLLTLPVGKLAQRGILAHTIKTYAVNLNAFLSYSYLEYFRVQKI